MIHINAVTGGVSFHCIICDESDGSCHECRKELSSYNMGYSAGNNAQESKAIFYDGILREIYEEGYMRGKQARIERGVDKNVFT